MTEILFVGAKSCGKTLLIKRLQILTDQRRLTPFDEIPSTNPTEGIDTQNFKYHRDSFVFKELSGDSIQQWESNARTAKAIVYVFDSADLTKTATNIVWLNEVLQSHVTENKPIMIVLSKCDVPDCIRFNVIDDIIGFDRVPNPSRLSFLETSSVVGVGLSEIFHWLSDLSK
ncbi:hypothetical protein TVAG_149300 [Trichomonas vaginalis G3]|uniref:Small GTP-binding protein n=1 Tax=Trichomonas vaginalis (strain ATCC PRA-98 / G3) TaxID=412133 RepID=A2ELJ7_TRIV3|nr:GTP binding [Trichomonas vaginalis G3]EAY06444.1 hypothetical protein TVAG_149300 [Trichomonas vaginalis G3]KAI5548028.1 GTP binding [Trichomonas vaginalis G3]|eukprot:XP_001318667.1 hypothetical protein [Trichomonas vaginalis G3]